MPMPALQDVIHKIEVGEWTRYVKLGVAVLGLIAFGVLYDLRQFKNFSTEEAMDTAQLARNLARGKGYTTSFIRPLSFYLLQKRQVETKRGDGREYLRGNHPDLANPPVYPAVLAGAMKVLPFDYQISKGASFWRYQPEVLIAILNQLLFFGAILLLFRLGLRLFDAPVAWLSTIIFAGTELLWRFSVSGLSTMLLVVLTLGLVWCLVLVEQGSREPAPRPIRLLLLAGATGAIIGIGALTRYAYFWLLLPVIIFYVLFLGQFRVRLSLTAAAVCVILVAPWLARNYTLSGNLLGVSGLAVYSDTIPQFKGSKLERYMSEDYDSAMAKVGLDQVIKKLKVNAVDVLHNQLLNLGGNWASAFFFVGLLVQFLNPTLNRLRAFLVLALIALGTAQCLAQTHLAAEAPEVNSENLLVVLAPLAILFGVAMFFLLLDQVDLPFPPTRTIVTAAFALFTCAPLILAILPPRSFPVAYPPYWPPMVQDVAEWMKPGELMMSDMPWAVAWYGDRQCLWATLDAPSDLKTTSRSDFFTFHDYYKPIQGILLTRITTDAKWFSQMIQGQDYAWGKFMLECLLRTNVPTGFPLQHSPPSFLQNGLLFLSDRERWVTYGSEHAERSRNK